MRHMMGFLNRILALLEEYRVRLVARVYVKKPNVEFKGASVYPSAIQRLAQAFEDMLMRENDKGVFVLDSRNKVKNVPVSHGLFTWNFSSHGSAYRYMAELPLFGHSENHAMLQLSDWIGSAFLAPMASSAYCSAYMGQCVHVVPQFDEIRKRFGQRIKHLQYRFERDGKKLGGIHVLGGQRRLRSGPVARHGAHSRENLWYNVAPKEEYRAEEPYVAWMKSAEAHGPDSVFYNWGDEDDIPHNEWLLDDIFCGQGKGGLR